MAISDSQKLDYLWKKLGYGNSKTDTNDNKLAVNEAISSPLLLRGDNLWTQSDQIPGTIPGSTSQIVLLYPTTSPIECTVDGTATANRTWKTGVSDWISPEFGATYLVKVYVHTSGDASNAASNGTQLFAAGSGNNDEWFFDYQSGLLNFIGTNLPNGINFSGKSIYISGARYVGQKGNIVSAGAATTFSSLTVGAAVTINSTSFEIPENFTTTIQLGHLSNVNVSNIGAATTNYLMVYDPSNSEFKFVSPQTLGINNDANPDPLIDDMGSY